MTPSECAKVEKTKRRRDKKRRKRGSSYAGRDETLLKMGFQSYDDYRASHLWKRIRRKVLNVKGRTCMTCPSPAEVVHHNRYAPDDMRGRCLEYLVPICLLCHHAVEHDKDGRKHGVVEAFAAWRRLRKTWLELSEVVVVCQ